MRHSGKAIKMKKHIANLFTLMNLFFGCMAIVAAMQTGLVTSTDESGMVNSIILPEKIYYASIFIGCAAIVDFFDGFVARLLGISSNLGKELDSLADVVSFGVAPSMIMYQFLRMSLAQQANGLEASMIWLLPAFLFAIAGAYRLGRFNVDTSHSTLFTGVPIPAAGMTIAAFPLIYWFGQYHFITLILFNKWFWYAIILLLSYLMVCKKPMLSLKFKQFSVAKDWPILILVGVSVIGIFTIHWLTVPIVFALYVILSLITIKEKN